MAGPIVLIDVSTVREGMLDELKSGMSELAEFVEASGTRAISYQFFLSADERDTLHRAAEILARIAKD